MAALWEPHLDPKSNRTYWSDGKVSYWKPPKHITVATDPASGHRYYHCSKTKRSVWLPFSKQRHKRATIDRAAVEAARPTDRTKRKTHDDWKVEAFSGLLAKLHMGGCASTPVQGSQATAAAKRAASGGGGGGGGAAAAAAGAQKKKLSKKGSRRKVGGPSNQLRSSYEMVHSKMASRLQSAGCGVVGLRNLGNTCFMNSALQCLSNTVNLTDYFLGFEWQTEINADNPLGSGGQLARAYGSLVDQLWSKDANRSSALTPKSFKRSLERVNPMFAGYEQHDTGELLTFLLDGLHEDLNRVEKKPYVEEVECDGRSEDEVSREAWKGYLLRNKSIVVDIFQGQLRSTLRCLECGYARVKFDPFMYLTLPIPKKGGRKTDIMACLDVFCAEETLDGDEQWYCPKCKTHVDARKKLDLWKMPPVLIIILKRFEFDLYGNRSKLDAHVAFPVQDLDFRGYVQSKEREPPIFDLFAFANHMGGFGGGHYTAVANNRVDEEWYLFNDSDVSVMEVGTQRERNAAANSAYVLFYNRVLAGENDMDGSLDAIYGSTSDTSLGSGRSHAPVVRRQSVTLPHLWPHYSADSSDDLDDMRLPAVDE